MEIEKRIIAAVAPHPAVRNIELIGSRAEGRASEWSDWDFLVQANDFAVVAKALPHLLKPLEPLVQQWDRLSLEYCWMLIVRGPAKVDLIFPDERHANESPWKPAANNLGAIDAHFWDWMLWLRGKETRGKGDLVVSELAKLFDHLLAPLGVKLPPSSISEAVAGYRAARDRAERRFDRVVRREVEAAVAPALADPSESK
jgi:predicted nucleotidyltransferase